jgi:chromosome partitioning protein
MKTLTVLSRKGGAGKTTVSLNLAFAARQAGLRTVLGDIDPLHSAGEVLRSRADAASFHFESTASKLFVLKDAAQRNGCDLLIVDTPASPDADIIVALNLSDFCVTVARPNYLDIAAIQHSLALTRQTGCNGLIVLNQCPPARGGRETAQVEQAIESLRFGHLPVARAKLRSRVAYQHAFAHSSAVTEWDPASEAAADVLRLLAEVSDHMALRRRFSDAPPLAPQAAATGARGLLTKARQAFS